MLLLMFPGEFSLLVSAALVGNLIAGLTVGVFSNAVFHLVTLLLIDDLLLLILLSLGM